ncbi:MAG: hypothetical protein ABW189_02585 [Rickettsiales bacterium]
MNLHKKYIKLSVFSDDSPKSSPRSRRPVKEAEKKHEWARQYVEISKNLRGLLLFLSRELCSSPGSGGNTEGWEDSLFGKNESPLGAVGKLAAHAAKLAETEQYWRDYLARVERGSEESGSEEFTCAEMDAMERFLRARRPEAFAPSCP